MSSATPALLSGTYTALVTPFREGQVDEAAFTRLVEDQIAAGIDGLVPVGTTGESATLSMEEHLRVIESSPLISATRSGNACRNWLNRSIEPPDSLIAMMLECALASAAIVSTAISLPVRPGTLYVIIVREGDFAIAP